MPGSNELIIILVIGATIFFVLPMIRKAPSGREASARPVSGTRRLALVASILWPALLAMIIEPWKEEVLKFIYIGIAPVVLAWAIGWVVVGFQKERQV